ncbi:MAG: general secretion pathway protein GspK [Gammaproteobacteria bacterium]|nr:general secretion pathway protein GspK [Gammaproteobacteria bacterium]
MAGSFALTMRRETTVISAVKDNAVILAAAETGITIAQEMLFLPDKTQRWHADGSIYKIQYKDIEIRVRLLSEHGKVDINKADETLLMTIMKSLPIEMNEQQALVSAIMDWRDQDDLVRINGAEKDQYSDAGLNYQPTNRDFQILQELQMVLGINSKVYQILQPLLTVYSGQSRVNLQVAAKEVLQVLAEVEPELMDDYLQQRSENQQLAANSPLTGKTAENQQNGNDVYSIISEARLFSEVTAGLKVTIKKQAVGDSASNFLVLDRQQIFQSTSLFSDEMEQQLVTDGMDENFN